MSIRSTRLNLCIAVALILLTASSSFAVALHDGLTWLNSSQTATVNWPDVDASEYYSTTTALDAVCLLAPTNFSYSMIQGDVVATVALRKLM